MKSPWRGELTVKLKETAHVLVLILGSNSESDLKVISSLEELSYSPRENHVSCAGCFSEQMMLIDELPFLFQCCGQ